MKPCLKSLSFVSFLTVVNALNLPRSQTISKRIDFTSSFIPRDNGASSDVTDTHDMIYFGNVNVGGTDYKVQLDTGSSDLWIKGKSSPIPGSTPSGTERNISYGIGYASGKVSYADVSFSGLTVKNQAFLDVTDTNSPVIGYTASGILGLGYDQESFIDSAINGTGKSSGRTFLYNLFAQNIKTPNYITFLLQRTTQPTDPVNGTFTIGELNPQFANIAQVAAIPTWPKQGTGRWTVLVDAVLVGDSTTITPTTSVPGVPSNQAVILVDTGSSYTYVAPEVAKAIYGNVPGSRFDDSTGYWFVPCDAEIDVAFQIGGQIFPLHPLDLSLVQNGDASSPCAGTFASSQLTVGQHEFDWIVGANFLRSVYSYFDFGDFDASGKMGSPYIKLLSRVDPDQASQDFHSLRGGSAKKGIVYSPVANAGDSAGGTTTITLGSNVANTLNKVGKYFPAMLGVMALNAIVLLALVVVGVLLLVKYQRKAKRSVSSKKREHPGRMNSMPLSGMDSMYSDSPGPSRIPHSYQPVSMALTDDTFVPPSPPFRKSEGSSLKDSDRPKSIA